MKIKSRTRARVALVLVALSLVVGCSASQKRFERAALDPSDDACVRLGPLDGVSAEDTCITLHELGRIAKVIVPLVLAQRHAARDGGAEAAQ